MTKKSTVVQKLLCSLLLINRKIWTVFGLPISIFVDVAFDKEAGVYAATGRNVRGLVIEAASLDDVKREIENVLSELLNINYPALGSRSQRTSLHINAALA